MASRDALVAEDDCMWWKPETGTGNPGVEADGGVAREVGPADLAEE